MTWGNLILLAGLTALTGCGLSQESDYAEKSLGLRVDETLAEKTDRIGLYLASAKKAESEGFVQTSVYLNEVAEEEIEHAGKLAAMSSRVLSTKKNLKTLYSLERTAGKITYPALAARAKKSGNEAAAILFQQLADDEKRHTAGLKALLKDIR